MTVVGSRPQFIKAAMVSRAIVARNQRGENQQIIEEIIHTGQHYDENMSDIFFQQMHIPEPAVNLNTGSGSHGEMTGRMLEKIEKEIVMRNPDWVLVYGDTNSTLAGALAAAKLHVSVAHMEAGLRSYNKGMPEEINRILTDHVSSLLFCPTKVAIANLAKEGISRGVHHVGDVMYDASLVFDEIAGVRSRILDTLDLEPGKYLLATVHRAENTDDPTRLQSILSAFSAMNERVVFPIHPRTRSRLDALNLKSNITNLKFIDPVSFLDMVQLEKNARVILTDSGGVQKEAYFHGVPCVTLRDETEWVETVAAGWNVLAGTDADRIIASTRSLNIPVEHGMLFGDGSAAGKITDLLVKMGT
ncbi:MAG: UDP-N-acetylglucosamine 2-epimerase (non-hydrolyzing) [Acidobacteria bacterium]|nr:UDP-N-acetylglucosamine 2-epimerase (non-hydrolyzing) [Acidobacteriota bacterium]MBU4307784.1 UDP-N-acetylglucosamine 2-epimerase (non-hydrolyzing) [Acidobacteriota bacterium]MCG2810391.1 UDP-N-acetylglucosamine 2-epimerase (non-hydrolyzing) [Candidatus Aminicenantes bacterium]